MRGRWTLLAGLAAAVALSAVASGCGGARASSSLQAGATGAGAAVAPASATAFVAIDTDQGSSQWKAADALLAKFPGWQQLLDSVALTLAPGSKLNVEQVLPYLGPELDLAVLGGGSTAQVVAIAKPSDAAKLDAALAQGSHPAVHEQVGGWTIFAAKQTALDAFTTAAAQGKLADDPAYEASMAKLSGDAVAKLYVDGVKLAAGQGQQKPLPGSIGGGTLVSAVAQAVAKADGLALEAVLARQGGARTAPYKSALLDQAPAGALVYASFKGGGEATAQLQQLLRNAGSLSSILGKLAPLLGGLGPVLGNENALYVRNGSGLVPEITLVAQPDSPTQALADIDQLAAKLGVTPQPVTIGGVQAKELGLGQFSIYYAVDGGKVVVTDSKQAFADLNGSGPRLPDDANFKEAVAVSGLPDATSGFVYVDLKDAVPVVESLLSFTGSKVSKTVMDDLQPLRTLVVWSSDSGAETHLSGFLEIK